MVVPRWKRCKGSAGYGGISLHMFLGLSVVHDCLIFLWSKRNIQKRRNHLELVAWDWWADCMGQETKAQLERLATLEQQLQKLEETEKKVLSIWVRSWTYNYTILHPLTADFFIGVFALTPWFGCTMSLHIGEKHDTNSGKWRVKGSWGPGVRLKSDHPGARCWGRGVGNTQVTLRIISQE